MKKFLFVLFGVFVVIGAFAAGENIPTSKSYVDSKLGEKQDIIPANDGAVRVLTNTGTAGEYGTKGIYDATGEYATQTQNLVDAATMNAGVQNAIDSEFQCIEWLDPNDHSSDCLLFDVFGETERRSPNVFDSSQILKASGWTENNGVYSGQINLLYRLGQMNACSPEPCKENTQYTLSYTTSVDENATPNGPVQPYLYIRYTDGTATKPAFRLLPTNPGDTSHIVLTSNSGKTVAYINASYDHTAPSHISNIQLQEGTVATPYVPYGNIYIPAGN
jgi:hypothetical protein